MIDFVIVAPIGERVKGYRAKIVNFSFGPKNARLTCVSSMLFSKRQSNQDGPVAQLGARFHGMEEVIGSNPIRSTKSRN